MAPSSPAARPKLPTEPEERLKKQDLFLIPAATDMQGTKLLDRDLPINRNIAGFIDLRIVKQKRELPKWSEREIKGPGQ